MKLLRKKRKIKTPGELGHKFEEATRRVFESNSYILLKKNYVMNNYGFEQGKATKREYDLVMLKWPEKQVSIIECKSHFEDALVSLDDIREFGQKTRGYNGLSANRVLVTDTDFSYKASKYAYDNRIATINGQALKKMEREGSIATMMVMRSIGHVIQGYTSKIDRGLEALLRI